MKPNKSLYLAMLAAAVCTGFTSCSNNDDDGQPTNTQLWVGELGAPAYEADAVAYNITNSSEFGSIELTASGNYIVMPPMGNHGQNAPVAKSAPAGRTMFHKTAPSARDYSSNGIFGEYTKLADGSYNLKGFGILGPLTDGTLDLTLENGTEYILDAIKISNMESNALNNRFCRTWYVESVTIAEYDAAGNLTRSQTLSKEEIREDYVRYVVVTKAGTFMQTDWHDVIEGYGEWHWYDTANQVFTYRFLDDDDDDTGSEQVAFQNDKAIFLGSYPDYNDYDQLITVVEQVVATAK
jgi:hypothetical protein